MPRTIFSTCSLLMAPLFAYSASVQLNDHDWYFWFPLYCCACVVNLIHGATSERCINVSKFAFWLGLFLFVKLKAPFNMRMQISEPVKYGAAILVGISYGLPFVFFVIQKGEMRF